MLFATIWKLCLEWVGLEVSWSVQINACLHARDMCLIYLVSASWGWVVTRIRTGSHCVARKEEELDAMVLDPASVVTMFRCCEGSVLIGVEVRRVEKRDGGLALMRVSVG